MAHISIRNVIKRVNLTITDMFCPLVPLLSAIWGARDVARPNSAGAYVSTASEIEH